MNVHIPKLNFRWTMGDMARIEHMAQQRKSTREIAAVMGASEEEIAEVCARNHITTFRLSRPA